ncbi:MAG: hypothetical protein JKY37_19005 [Nannocystaceae bacterium]|nr:hypothetical protein [Nannocystaceae bacterium]
MERPHSLVCIALLSLTACGPTRLPEAELSDLCGQPGPVRLMALDPGEMVGGSTLHIPAPTDRIVLVTSRLGIGDNRLDEEDGAQSRVWSVDPCGESATQIAEGLDLVWTEPHWDDRLLGCNAAGDDIYVLDADGVLPPRLAFEGTGCRGRWTNYGFVPRQVADDDGFGPALLYPYPEGNGEVAEPVTVHPGLFSMDGAIAAGRGWPRVTDTEILALSRDGNLVRVDLETSAVSVEAQEVFDFRASDDRLLTQEHGDGQGHSGPIFMTDRDTQSTTYLMDGVLSESYAPFDVRGRSTVIIATGAPDGELRVLHPPATDDISVLGGYWLAGLLEDGRLLLAQGGGGPYALLDPDTGEQTEIFDREADVSLAQDGIVLHDVPTCCRHEEGYRVEGALLLERYAGGQEMLAARAARGWRRNPDARIVARIDIDQDNVGRLIAIDPTSGGQERVVHAAVSQIFGVAAWPNDLWYSTADRDPAVYRARLKADSPR